MSEEMSYDSEEIVENGNNVLPRVSDLGEHLLQNDDDLLYENQVTFSQDQEPAVTGTRGAKLATDSGGADPAISSVPQSSDVRT